MTLDQSALLEVLDARRNADAADRITQAPETIFPGAHRCGLDGIPARRLRHAMVGVPEFS